MQLELYFKKLLFQQKKKNYRRGIETMIETVCVEEWIKIMAGGGGLE